ncbi:two-component system activity regulator YycH [Paenibacillus soyae]|uniref:Two-component system activity regulator YycH n=1 Tax=Paenibacillus soyae TaxID=2969249 RepID=A0A9X2SB75_9BACL|nr:two-component system activity regulator YycH [Paenibacillus soyae]MCR2805373.1 two-component system activity regulator YycH [Paenibacillus soyae]
MMEKAKTTILIVLVALSLLQSYLLAYSMPGLGAAIRSEQNYVNPETLGTASSVENVIFPEEIILHKGGDKHTVIYPGTQFYEMILNQRIVGREFKGFQRSPASILDWDEVRKTDIGIELRFADGISVELLQKLLKLEGDLLFLNERIDNIWILKTEGTEEIRTFFFSSEEDIVYESVRADLTVRDVQDYVGFGEHLPEYRMTADGLYIPEEPFMATEMVFPYETYTPEQMQRSLFFDSSTTRAFVDRSGSQIFTDGKRGLKVEQGGLWINYTNPAATTSNETPLSENVYVSVNFINDHGGWDGTYRLMSASPEEEAKYVTFRKYIEHYPVVDTPAFQYGHMQLTLQKGVITEYARSLITLGARSESRTPRWLQGGETVEDMLEHYPRRGEVTALFPALKSVLLEEGRLMFVPVWVVRLAGGAEEVLLEAYPAGYEPVKTTQDAPDATEDASGQPANADDEAQTGGEIGTAAADGGNADGKAVAGGVGSVAETSESDGQTADWTLGDPGTFAGTAEEEGQAEDEHSSDSSDPLDEQSAEVFPAEPNADGLFEAFE